MKIGSRNIGLDSPPMIIAEMSGNHNMSLDRAFGIVRASAEAGAHALKLQTYTAATMTLNEKSPDFIVKDKNSPWHGQTLYNLYEQAHTPWDWHEPIKRLAEQLGLIFISTPFDSTALDFLEGLNTQAYKIASFEVTDLELVSKIAATGKPVIMSTGMATLEELELSVDTAKRSGCKDLILLKCTSNYPADPTDSNILTLADMRERFECEVGLSDHTLGIGVAVTAVAHGAVTIEKHLTINRTEGGVDSAFSMEPKEFQELISETYNAWQALGTVKYGPSQQEKKSLQFRRSLYFTKKMMAGDLVTRECVRSIRPGFGLAPKHLQEVLGRTIKEDVFSGMPLSWDLLDLNEDEK